MAACCFRICSSSYSLQASNQLCRPLLHSDRRGTVTISLGSISNCETRNAGTVRMMACCQSGHSMRRLFEADEMSREMGLPVLRPEVALESWKDASTAPVDGRVGCTGGGSIRYARCSLRYRRHLNGIHLRS